MCQAGQTESAFVQAISNTFLGVNLQYWSQMGSSAATLSIRGGPTAVLGSGWVAMPNSLPSPSGSTSLPFTDTLGLSANNRGIVTQLDLAYDVSGNSSSVVSLYFNMCWPTPTSAGPGGSDWAFTSGAIVPPGGQTPIYVDARWAWSSYNASTQSLGAPLIQIVVYTDAAARSAWIAGGRSLPPTISGSSSPSTVGAQCGTGTFPSGGFGVCQAPSTACFGVTGDAASTAGPCSNFNSPSVGSACKAQAATNTAAGDKAIMTACAACAACSPTSGSCTCPVECTLLYPKYSTMPYLQNSGDGDSVYNWTIPQFVTQFMELAVDQREASAGGYQLVSGQTPVNMAKDIGDGLLGNLECWWPAAYDTATEIMLAQSATPAAPGATSCADLLLTSSLRDKYARRKETCPVTAGTGVQCKEAVAAAMMQASSDYGNATKMSQAQAYLLCEACGINAGIQPLQQPQSQLPIVMGVLAGVLLITLIGVAIWASAKKKKTAT